MAAVIIRKKDLIRLSKSILKEVNDFLHNEYILYTFEKMKEEKEKFLKNLALKNFHNADLWFIKDQDINTEGIYQIIDEFELDKEMDEDLYFKRKAFLDLFRVYNSGYIYLEER